MALAEVCSLCPLFLVFTVFVWTFLWFIRPTVWVRANKLLMSSVKWLYLLYLLIYLLGSLGFGLEDHWLLHWPWAWKCLAQTHPWLHLFVVHATGKFWILFIGRLIKTVLCGMLRTAESCDSAVQTYGHCKIGFLFFLISIRCIAYGWNKQQLGPTE